MFTQSVKFYTFYCHILKSIDVWNNLIHQTDRKWTVAPFSKFYGRIWVGFCLTTGKRFFHSKDKEHSITSFITVQQSWKSEITGKILSPSDWKIGKHSALRGSFWFFSEILISFNKFLDFFIVKILLKNILPNFFYTNLAR